MEKSKPKNALKREKLFGQDGIYYDRSKGSNTFDIVVSMRIGKRQIQRKRNGVVGVGNARQVRKELIQELEKLKGETHLGDIFWSQAVEQYLKHLEAMLITGEMTLSTFKTRESSLETHTKSWNSKKLSELHQHWIRLFFAEHFKDEKDKRALATKKNLLKFIKQVFNHQIALGNKTLVINPTVGFRLNKSDKQKPETFSKDEIEKIIRYAHEVKSPWAAIYYLGYQLGARSGELFGLEWKNVNWVNETITIARSYCWKLGDYKSTKNSESRTLPLNQPTIKYLKDLKSKSNEDNILPHLSAWKKGQAAQILRSVMVKTKIITEEEMDKDKRNFHSIRSTFITRLLLEDEPPIKVMELSGHKDFKTTQIYVRSVGKELKGTTDKLGFEIAPNNIVPMKKQA